MNRNRSCLQAVALAWMGLTAAGGADVRQMPDGLRSLELVDVGHPGNPPDDTGLGAVAYPFFISKYEITAAQWVEFLNAKAKADADGGLWNNDMDSVRSGEGVRCEIRRAGEKGAYVHSVQRELANRPVTHVSFLDACRFCNWLHNGQGDGDTENGAYTLNGYFGTDARRIQRNPGAQWFVPSEDEWYKAAYFDPAKSGGAGYWNYPVRSDEKPDRDFESARGVNFYAGGYLDPKRFFTDAGRFANAASAYGTFDQGGNALEWTEGFIAPFLRNAWGGAFDLDDGGRNGRAPNRFHTSISDVQSIGFRVASAAPGHEAKAASAPAPTEPAAAASKLGFDFPRRPWLDPQTGKPFFPLAWFSYQSDERDLDDLAREGANLVLFVNTPTDVDTEEQLRDNIPKMLRYLDHAQKRAIKVLIQTGGWFSAHQRGDAAEIIRQRQWVEAMRGHPALFGYQLYDEPEYRAGGGLGVEEQERLREFVDALSKTRDSIRQWDGNPQRFISVVFNLVPLSSWIDYLPVVDSFQVDRYPLDKQQAYFGHRGDWGPLMMAWSMAHGAAAMRDHPHLRNPAPCMQGVGWLHTESGELGLWRDPLYEETRYMAYSSLTVGAWGVFHWIRCFGRPDSSVILNNVARLHTELRSLFPALERSYEKPPFTARHNHEEITRGFLTDSVPDLTTLPLEDEANYFLIVSNNSASFTDITLRMKLPAMNGAAGRQATVLNEGWSRSIDYSEETGEWVIDKHTMCFGDINIWVIPKIMPPE
ncbi:MAG: formylglycine-generating enzyme family protein [Verrucomicrobiales bacterium]